MGCLNFSLRRVAGKREMTSGTPVPVGARASRRQGPSKGLDPFIVAPLLASRRAPTGRAKPMPVRSLRILAAACWLPRPAPREFDLKNSLAFSGTVADIPLRLRLFVDVLSTFNSARDNTGGFRLSAVSPIEVFGHVDRAQPPRVLVALEGSSDPDTRSCMWHVVL